MYCDGGAALPYEGAWEAWGDDPLGAAEADADAVTAGADPLALDPGMGTATTPLATCAEAAPMSEGPSKNAEYMLMRISLST